MHSSISNIGKLADGTAPELAREIFSRIDLARTTLLAPALPFNSLMKDYLDQCAAFVQSPLPPIHVSVQEGVERPPYCTPASAGTATATTRSPIPPA